MDSTGREWLAAVCARASRHAFERGNGRPLLGVDDPDVSKIRLGSERRAEKRDLDRARASYKRAHASSSTAASSIVFLSGGSGGGPDAGAATPSDDRREADAKAAASVEPDAAPTAYRTVPPSLPDRTEFDLALVTQWTRSMIPGSKVLETPSPENLASDVAFFLRADSEALAALAAARGEYDVYAEDETMTLPYMDYRAVVGALQRQNPGTELFHAGPRTMAPAFRSTTARFPSFDSRFIDVADAASSSGGTAARAVIDVAANQVAKRDKAFCVEDMAMLDAFDGFWDACEVFVPADAKARIEEVKGRPGLLMSYGSVRQSEAHQEIGIASRIHRWVTVHGASKHVKSQAGPSALSCHWSALIAVVQGQERDAKARSHALALALEGVVSNCLRTFVGDRDRLYAVYSRAARVLSCGASVVFVAKVVKAHASMPASLECSKRHCAACYECAVDGSLWAACLAYYSFLPERERLFLSVKIGAEGPALLKEKPAPPPASSAAARREDETPIVEKLARDQCQWRALVAAARDRSAKRGFPILRKLFRLFCPAAHEFASGATSIPENGGTATGSRGEAFGEAMVRGMSGLCLGGIGAGMAREVENCHARDASFREGGAEKCAACLEAARRGLLVPAAVFVLRSAVPTDGRGLKRQQRE